MRPGSQSPAADRRRIETLERRCALLETERAAARALIRDMTAQSENLIARKLDLIDRLADQTDGRCAA